MVYQPELVVEAKALVGESPCWDSENGVLYWVDVLGKRLHVYRPEYNSNSSISLGQLIGCVVPRTKNSVALALQHGFASLDLETEDLTILIDPEAHIPTNRFNDGKCDPVGRFVAGTMGIEDNVQGAGSLYSLDENLQVKKLLSNLTISNGLCWSLDSTTMYHIDSPTRQVTAFHYDLETGLIQNGRMIITIPEDKGLPDGMTIDQEGKVWIALWGGGAVTRWDPITGVLLESIALPAPNVTSCTFGGPELRDLYVTTARHGMKKNDLENYPLAGGLFRLKTLVIGTQAVRFVR